MELDEFLCLSFPLLNKGFLRRQVRDGRVLVDGGPANPSQRLRTDQVLVIDFDESEGLPEAPVAPKVDIPVLYEDEHLLAVDKPTGLASEPERWARGNASLSGGLLELALDRSKIARADPTTPASGLEFRPRLLHRLDKDTTGVVLVAKTIEAERQVREAFDTNRVTKTYIALVEGEYGLADGEEEIVDLPIGPDEKKSGRMQVDRKDGKPSQTRIRIEQRFRGYTLLRCQPLTGRTHQIRVHMREVGFPLAVDPVYGRRNSLSLSEIKRDYHKKPGSHESPLIDRLTLHALAIELPAVAGEPGEPNTNGEANTNGDARMLRIEAPIPRDFARLLKQLAKVRAP
jgi:23S rRNA pseudouridine1911/1915/1917 synthase